jgi:hypothetical protein
VHPARDLFELTEHHEVKVVPHQAEGEQAPLRSQRREAKKPEEAVAVLIVDEDVAAVDAAHRQVVRAVIGQVVSSQPGDRSTVTTTRAKRIGAPGPVRPCNVPGTVPTT